MTEEDRKLISSFEGKLRHLMFLFDELKQENADLKLLLSKKDEEIKQLEQSRKELEAQYTDLKMECISADDYYCGNYHNNAKACLNRHSYFFKRAF